MKKSQDGCRSKRPGGQKPKKHIYLHTAGTYSYQILPRNMIFCSFMIGGWIQRGFRNCSSSKANSNGSSQYSTFKICSYTVCCATGNAPIEGAVLKCQYIYSKKEKKPHRHLSFIPVCFVHTFNIKNED